MILSAGYVSLSVRAYSTPGLAAEDDVGEQHVWRLAVLRQHRGRVARVVGAEDRVTLRRQQPLHQRQHARVVFDEEDRHTFECESAPGSFTTDSQLQDRGARVGA